MMEDLGRLRDRVVKLQQHHTQTGDDLRQILISSEKIEKRATRIEELEFDGEDGAKDGASDGLSRWRQSSAFHRGAVETLRQT